METKVKHVKKIGLAVVGSFLWLAATASAQSTANAQSTPAQSGERTTEDRDRDSATRQEFARFDQFLDSHREIGEQLRRNPTLVNDQQFLKDHPALQSYLQDHPRIATQLTDDPNAFMRGEMRYDRREDQNREMSRNSDRDLDRDADRDRGQRQEEAARFNQFLDSHREVAEQLRKNPTLVNDANFVKNHPALQSYLQQHPMVRDDLARNPDAFLHQETSYGRREPSDLTAAQTDRNASPYDRDSSRYDGREQSRYNGSKDTAGYQERTADNDRDRDAMTSRSASFGSFLGTHSAIAHQLSNNPSLANDQSYLQSHPELQSYLSTHPEVRNELMQNPQEFLKSAQQYNNGTTKTSAPPSASAPPATPTPSQPSQPHH